MSGTLVAAMANEDEDNPVPSLEVPGPVAFERASESVIATGQFDAVNQVGAISSSPLLVGGVTDPAESSLNVASAVPNAFDSSRAVHRASLRVGQTKNELPLKTVVMIAGGVVLAGILLSLLLFR